MITTDIYQLGMTGGGRQIDVLFGQMAEQYSF